MSWFWGSKSKQDDPTQSLDADLKKFLDEQQPKPYTPTQLPAAPSSDAIEAAKKPLFENPDSNKIHQDRPLPKESLFQDGRYAHLWKTYTPQMDVDAATEKPTDIITRTRKDRKSTISSASLENCAFEQELKEQCLGLGMKGKLKSRMTMCEEETKTWNRCFTLQGQFLQALGYMQAQQDMDEEEKIQMHADKLYHRMMDYEASVDDARNTGLAVPPLTSVFHPDKAAPKFEDIKLPDKVGDAVRKTLSEMAPHERELAARAAIVEAKFGNKQADAFFAATTTMNEDRKKRQTWAIKTFGEPIGKFFIPDAPEDLPRQGLGPSPAELEKTMYSGQSGSGQEATKG